MTPVAQPRVGAFEAETWAGLVVMTAPGVGGAVRLALEVDGRPIAPADLYFHVHEVGPHAPDASYARVAFDLTSRSVRGADSPIVPVAAGEASLTWEWARVDDTRVACRLRIGRSLRVWIEAGAPWDWPGTWSASGLSIEGRLGVECGADVGPECRLDVVHGPPVVATDGGSDGRSARLAFDCAPGDVVVVVVTLGVDHQPPEAVSVPSLPAIECHRILDDASHRYETARVVVDGAWHGLAAAVTNNLHWMVLLQPESGRRYVPAGRRWIFPSPEGRRDHWTVFEWDGFFNALLLSLEAPDLAIEMLDTLAATQYPSGLLPNWRSRLAGTPDRSQPPIGAFIVLKVVLRTGRTDLAARWLPALDAWHAWWAAPVGTRRRRQRPSGLYAWGSDLDAVAAWVPPWERDTSPHQKAAWESGQDDLPNWDEAPWDEASSTLAMEAVDLSAYVALDAECLAALHERAGDAARAAAYRAEHARLCALIDARLWDGARGVWVDLLDSGRRSPRLAASNFLPLLAGAGTRAERARAVALLEDPSRFWGEWIVPSLSRDDVAFPSQQYWRGTIWPPINYLLYEALHRVGEADAASELAARSVALFLGDWQRHQVCRENFSSIDGSGGGQRHQSWAPLFAWTGLAEFADVSPWDGLRFGSTSTSGSSSLRRVHLLGRRWEVMRTPTSIRITSDDVPWCEADAPVCLRHVERHGGRWRADVTARQTTRMTWPRAASRVLPAGTTRVEWEG